MADETETGALSEVVVTDAKAEMPVAKKQRAPRRSKAAIEAALAAAKSAATMKAPSARKKVTADTPPTVVQSIDSGKMTKNIRVKKVGTDKTPKQVVVTAKVSASDEMADLIQLETENKRLRSALAEKLRSENEDLRKRLGV